MYSRISIRNFRGIATLDGDGFRRINLILGRNNAGKTTFLESLLLLGGAANPQFATSLGPLRGQRFDKSDPDSVWRPLFHDLDPLVPIEIDGVWGDDCREIKLKIEASESPNPIELLGPSVESAGIVAVTTTSAAVGALRLISRGPGGDSLSAVVTRDPDSKRISTTGSFRPAHVRTSLLTARLYSNQARDARQFSSIRKDKHQTDVVDALRIIEPRVGRIEVLSEPSGPSIYLDIGLDTLVPLAVCGEGLARLFTIILELVASRDGVLLIDEIDSGLHFSVMPKFWELLGTLVEKHNVQVFGTTHNDDIIRSALDAFAEQEGVLGLFRIDQRGERHVMVGYSDEAMQGVREMSFEVRGMTLSIMKPKILVVEGRDEEMFFGAALRDHLGLTDIQVIPIGGKTKLTQNLATLVTGAGFPTVQSLAIIRDADSPIGDPPASGPLVSEADKAFQSVCGSLRHVGLSIPAAHGQFAVGPPRVGIFIVPNGVDDGMLETLCIQSVANLPEFPCVDGFFQCLQGFGAVPNNLHKARAHAWLASRPEPDRRVGEAAQAGYWPWDSDAFRDLWAFIGSS